MKSENSFITHCKQCHNPYDAQRKTSKFCSDKCRLKYSRRNVNGVNKELEVLKANQALDRLLNLSDDALLEDAYMLQTLIERAEKLKKRRLDALSTFFGDAPVQHYCNHCGQARFTAPMTGDKCAFCGKEDWSK